MTSVQILQGIIVGALVVGGLAFLYFFLRPALGLRSALKRTLSKVDLARREKRWDLEDCFKGDPTLEHVWSEFQETLHKQRDLDPASGELVIQAVRSTVPAEVFFSTQAVIDTRVHAEFFKHLPGIFTGLGIIGTFSGLITGVSDFKVAGAANVVQDSLAGLLHGVGDAFTVSALAITLAMIVTLVEKFFINDLYGRLERQNQALDACFEAGAGEEYLARLVSAAEDSASQSKILKDALVNDLKQILEDLTERQIAATQQSSLALGDQISKSISSTLEDPLSKIAGAVGQVSQDQSAAVSKLLTDVLAGFAQRMEDLFGNQLAGISEMQQRTLGSLETAVNSLNELAGNLESAGSRATDAMAERLAGAMEAAEARQRAMSEELAKSLAQIREHGSEARTEAGEEMQRMITTMSGQISSAVAELQKQVAARASEQDERDRKHAAQTATQVDAVGQEVSRITEVVADVLAAVQAMVARLDMVSANLVDKLNGGAETLLLAAANFEKSGREASSSFSTMATVSNGLSNAATLIGGASKSLDSAISDHKAARDGVAQMVSALKETVAAASRDASVTSELVSGIEHAAAGLSAAQHQIDSYLEEVSDVLAQSHQRFAEGMRQTVGDANRAFHTELTQATSLLRDAINELEFALPSGPNRAAAG